MHPSYDSDSGAARICRRRQWRRKTLSKQSSGGGGGGAASHSSQTMPDRAGGGRCERGFPPPTVGRFVKMGVV